MKKRVNINLDVSDIEKIKQLAKQEHTSVSGWITKKILESSIDERKIDNDRFHEHI